jgi:hypothetical protein
MDQSAPRDSDLFGLRPDKPENHSYPGAVMPAKADIHLALIHTGKWMPAFASMTALRVVE